ncbi:MAG: hypothetical protein OEU26_22030, partial [Candidatus Tectomicrobia bacterium]|nr:hypothetical protein [Candidatus Tectomicrobia bacterium]
LRQDMTQLDSKLTSQMAQLEGRITSQVAQLEMRLTRWMLIAAGVGGGIAGGLAVLSKFIP